TLSSPSRLSSLVRPDLYVAPVKHPAETRKRSTCFTFDLRRRGREGTELLCIQQRFVNTLRARLEVDFLVDRIRHQTPSHFPDFLKLPQRQRTASLKLGGRQNMINIIFFERL